MFVSVPRRARPPIFAVTGMLFSPKCCQRRVAAGYGCTRPTRHVTNEVTCTRPWKWTARTPSNCCSRWPSTATSTRPFLRQIADSDPTALHVVIADQTGFQLPTDDVRLPANLQLLPLPPYCPEPNPVERFGGLLKAAVANRLYPTLRRLEDHLAAAARPWSNPAAVSSLIHTGLNDQVNSRAPT